MPEQADTKKRYWLSACTSYGIALLLGKAAALCPAFFLLLLFVSSAALLTQLFLGVELEEQLIIRQQTADPGYFPRPQDQKVYGRQKDHIQRKQ